MLPCLSSLVQNPERKASVASVSEQADPVESPVAAAEGAEEATDSTTTTINSKDSVNTEEGKAEEAAESLTEVGPEEDGVDDLENEVRRHAGWRWNGGAADPWMMMTRSGRQGGSFPSSLWVVVLVV